MTQPQNPEEEQNKVHGSQTHHSQSEQGTSNSSPADSTSAEVQEAPVYVLPPELHKYFYPTSQPEVSNNDITSEVNKNEYSTPFAGEDQGNLESGSNPQTSDNYNNFLNAYFNNQSVPEPKDSFEVGSQIQEPETIEENFYTSMANPEMKVGPGGSQEELDFQTQGTATFTNSGEPFSNSLQEEGSYTPSPPFLQTPEQRIGETGHEPGLLDDYENRNQKLSGEITASENFLEDSNSHAVEEPVYSPAPLDNQFEEPVYSPAPLDNQFEEPVYSPAPLDNQFEEPVYSWQDLNSAKPLEAETFPETASEINMNPTAIPQEAHQGSQLNGPAQLFQEQEGLKPIIPVEADSQPLQDFSHENSEADFSFQNSLEKDNQNTEIPEDALQPSFQELDYSQPENKLIEQEAEEQSSVHPSGQNGYELLQQPQPEVLSEVESQPQPEVLSEVESKTEPYHESALSESAFLETSSPKQEEEFHPAATGESYNFSPVEEITDFVPAEKSTFQNQEEGVVNLAPEHTEHSSLQSQANSFEPLKQEMVSSNEPGFKNYNGLAAQQDISQPSVEQDSPQTIYNSEQSAVVDNYYQSPSVTESLGEPQDPGTTNLPPQNNEPLFQNTAPEYQVQPAVDNLADPQPQYGSSGVISQPGIPYPSLNNGNLNQLYPQPDSYNNSSNPNQPYPQPNSFNQAVSNQPYTQPNNYNNPGNFNQPYVQPDAYYNPGIPNQPYVQPDAYYNPGIPNQPYVQPDAYYNPGIPNQPYGQESPYLNSQNGNLPYQQTGSYQVPQPENSYQPTQANNTYQPYPTDNPYQPAQANNAYQPYPTDNPYQPAQPIYNYQQQNSYPYPQAVPLFPVAETSSTPVSYPAPSAILPPAPADPMGEAYYTNYPTAAYPGIVNHQSNLPPVHIAPPVQRVSVPGDGTTFRLVLLILAWLLIPAAIVVMIIINNNYLSSKNLQPSITVIPATSTPPVRRANPPALQTSPVTTPVTLPAKLTLNPSSLLTVAPSSGNTPIAKINEAVSQSGYTLLVTNIERADTFAENIKAKDGNELVAVELTVESSSPTGVYSSLLYCSLKDPSGSKFAALSNGRQPLLPRQDDIAQGGKVSGWATFEVPKGSKGLIFEYKPTNQQSVLFNVALDT